MRMMRDNPAIMASAQKMMEKMSPSELAESSRLAQEQMASMTPEQMEAAAKAVTSLPEEEVDKAVTSIKSMAGGAKGSSKDVALVDAMFKSAEFISKPPSGGVTLRAFKTLAPIRCAMVHLFATAVRKVKVL